MAIFCKFSKCNVPITIIQVIKGKTLIGLYKHTVWHIGYCFQWLFSLFNQGYELVLSKTNLQNINLKLYSQYRSYYLNKMSVCLFVKMFLFIWLRQRWVYRIQFRLIFSTLAMYKTWTFASINKFRQIKHIYK